MSEPRPLHHHAPNVLTGLRLVALVPFWWLLAMADGGHSWPAAVLFAVASVTDWFDGWLARRWAVQSRFGRLVDPLADRLLINSAVILLWWDDRLPWAIPVLIIGRDLALMLGLGAASRRGYELSVIYLGKTATSALMAGLFLVMATHDGARWPTYVVEVGLGLSLLAGAVYLATVRGRLRIEAENGGAEGSA